MKLLTAIFLFGAFILVESSHRQNHFGNPCYLCECFVEYTDRDQALASIPYKIALNGYDTTEDQCLATCLRDENCKAAVYAFIGGRDVFACELYDQVNTREPIYTPHSNLYIKRVTKCPKPNSHLLPIELIDGDEKILERKRKYLRLQQKFNPFHHGRK
uniref:Apple domain-containing protein n=1 Tax=Panagrolaimus superbus TaxID=310955 RepID=A0A914Z9I7_9BILA